MKKLLFLVTLLCAAFTASAQDGRPTVSGQSTTTLTHCWIDGQDEADRIDYDVTLNYTIVYNIDKTITVSFTTDSENFKKTVGMVPQLFIDNAYKGNFGNNVFSTTDPYEEGTSLPLYFYCAYNGGSGAFPEFTYIVGSDDDNPVNPTPGGDGDDDKEKPEAPETVPAPAHDASKVFSFFSPYGEVNFNNGGWGASTAYESVSIDGKPVLKLSNFNYLGLVDFNIDVADYDHMHVDYWTPTENTNFGFVPISLNPTEDKPIYWAESVKAGEWNSYDAELKNFNSDKTKIEQIKFDAQGGAAPASAYIANIYFWKDDSEKPDPDQPVDPEIPGEGILYVGRAEGTHTQNEIPYPYVFEYAIQYNEDKTLDVYGIFDFLEGTPTGDSKGSLCAQFPGMDATYGPQGQFFKIEQHTFDLAQVFELTLSIAVDFGRIEVKIPYTVGDEFEIQLPAEYAEKQESSNIDHVARELRLVTTEIEAVLYVAAPEGTTVSYLNVPTPTPDEVKARRIDAVWETATDNLIKLDDAQGTLSVKYIKDDEDGMTPVDDMTPVVYSYSVARNTETGVDTVESADKGEAVYFTLDGRKVTNPDKGIFIKVTEGKTEKIIK